MSKSNRGQIIYKTRKQYFDENPCLERARPVFIACREYDIPIPDQVLDIIYSQIKKEHIEWSDKLLTLSNKISERKEPKEKILSCALRTEKLVDAYQLYRDETGFNGDSDEALRRRLQRYLEKELPNFIESVVSKEYRHYYPIPQRLKDKVTLYKELNSLIF